MADYCADEKQTQKVHPTFSRLALPFWVSSALVTNYSFKYEYVKKMLQKSKKKR